MEILNYHFAFFFTFLFIFVSIGEIQVPRQQLAATQVTDATPVVATLPLHAQDEEQKNKIVELENVRDGHNISAMLSICKPETRGTVSEAVAKFAHESSNAFNVDRIGLRTAQLRQLSYSQLARLKTIAGPILLDLLSMFKVSTHGSALPN